MLKYFNMDYTYTLYFMMVIDFFLYTTYIWSTYGVQRSISDSYYRLPEKLQPLFMFFCWGFAFPAIIIGLSLVDSPLMFLAGTGIAFVGAAAEFKKEITKTVHMIGAYGGVGFSQLSIIIDYKLWQISAIFFGLALILEILYFFNIIKNKIWWEEYLAFISICILFGLKIFG